ncbi:hypothetical protein GQX73_g5991 [Xylaria multiplex]|uniref:AMP-dependent synthetase/ligase domain-containing protein n=1 Tax=Xylaria multiplex TaxID=323545 RepID=A0A7C8MTF7_9PEZI|nr:hypothetical protein GQX73_g5991 [Xylaria multiplex]
MDYLSYIFSRQPGDIDSPILIDADQPRRTISWRQYASAVKSIAVGLRALDFKQHEAVGLLSPNDPYYYVLADGVIAAGGTFAGIAPSVKEAELVTYIQAGCVSWLCASAEFFNLALTTAKKMGIDESRVILFDPPGRESEERQLSFSSLLGSDESVWQNPCKGGDPTKMVAMRQYTSGTTGGTKAVDICHDILIERVKRLDDADLSPLQHDKGALHYIAMFGVGGGMTHAKAVLGKLPAYFTSAGDAAQILDLVESFGITLIQLAVPMMEGFIAAIHAGVRSRDTLRSLQSVLVGGAASRKEGVEDFAALLPRHAILRTGYGSTEAASIATTPADMIWIPGIIDPETLETLSSEAEGEICVRGPRVFRNYCNNQAATDEAFLADASGGRPWYRTGDRGFLDPKNGQLAVTGRFKEIFKVKSQHVSPVEVEDELRKHELIADAAVTSVTSRGDDGDDECLAYVVRRAGGDQPDLTAQDVVDFVASRLAPYKAPTGGVIFCDRILRNDNGKVMRRRLGELQEGPGSARYLSLPAEKGK